MSGYEELQREYEKCLRLGINPEQWLYDYLLERLDSEDVAAIALERFSEWLQYQINSNCSMRFA